MVYIMTGTGSNSNWCILAKAAASKLGMKVVIIKSSSEDDYDTDNYDGNYLLYFLMG